MFGDFGGTEAASDDDDDDDDDDESDADSAVSSISATAGDSTSSGTGPQFTTEVEETGLLTTTGGPDETGGTWTGATTSDEPATTSSTSGTATTCGDDAVDGDDECDGADLAEMTCADVTPATPSGTLACNDDCTFDTSACVAAPDPVTMCSSPGLAIPDNGAAATDTLMIAEMGNATDVDVHVEITHTYIGDLTVNIVHGGDDIRVFDRLCGTEEDIDADFDDEAGAAFNCTNSDAGNAHQPGSPLTPLDGDDISGSWQIAVQDNAGADTGTLTMWCVTVSYD